MSLFSKLSLSFLFCFSAAVSAGPKPTIVGGTEAAPGEFPFIVSLQASSMGHFCGGSLIKPNWVLTAGHCIEGGHVKKIYLGLHNQKDKTRAELRTPKRVIRHPQYNDSNVDYDFALIELNAPSAQPPVNANIEEIQVPDLPEPQIMGMTAGWGETSASFKPAAAADRLQKVEVPLVPAHVCEGSYSGLLTDRMLCAGFPAGGRDSCYGDSGGPLVTRDAAGAFKLIGVVSWGEGCAEPNKYGVYAKVSAITDWIEETTR